MKCRYLIIAGIGIILIDRMTKIVILASKSDFVKNPGVAFGLGKSVPGILIFFLAVGFVGLVYLAKELDLKKSSSQIALGLILGGGISNILDRLFYGYVIDFINISNISAFNLADAGILVGAIIIILDFVKSPKMEKRK